ncbi:mediator of RNA polymerase II transcription subunit 15 [Vespula maculifrons]|uniref:Mediator of RNA polymerase II transcription subunit 15 n=1 Tax=Vespula maculifrons TaxID=7453 RepID=A0ABD2BJ84_VESMC
MATDENSWRTQNFRQSVVAKLDEAVQMSGMPTAKNSIEMESHVFQKAKSKEEYLSFIARLIFHVREMNSKKGAGNIAPGNAGSGGQGMPDPIGALQTLARQGTGNNQMIGMGGPGPNPQGIVPQSSTNTATNPEIEMSSLNNYYYAQYASISESEPNYDSDNPEVFEALKNSPTHIQFINIIEKRRNKELLYEHWKNIIRHESIIEIKDQIKKECGMKVQLRDRVVTYIYKPEIDNDGKYFRFKFVYRYSKILHKWYFSLGCSFLPDILKIRNVLKYDIHNPIGPKIIKIMKKMREIIDAFIESYLYIFQIIDYAEKKYPDIAFQVNRNHTNLKMLLMEKTWPKILQSLNQRPGQPMTMPGLPNKMSGMGMMQSVGTMSHMNAIQGMQSGAILTQINQMNQGNMPQQMNQMIPTQMNQITTGQMQQNMQNQMQNQLSGQMSNQIGGSINSMQTNMPQQMNQISSGQMGPAQVTQQLNHMQRKPGEIINTVFPGPRNVTPNQFLRQSPSPSAPSPAALAAPASNQMVASPALVPSPSPQHPIIAGPQRSVGMAPSPSSSLNTPVAVGATPSPQQEDQAYRDKVRQLSKYIEPLKRMISRMGNDGNVDKLSKMKRLLEILSTPSKRMPMETLLKCEVVLEKVDFKRGDGSVGPPITTLKEHHFFSPLLEAVSTHLQSPVVNHTLQRTFGPCLEALFGPEIKTLPPLKKQKIEEPPSEIPDVLQGEIARLDQRFKVSLDPAQQNGSKCIQLICWLDDRHLPCVPPVSVIVPADYPLTPPRCVMTPHEYTTTFLCAVQKALNARIAKLPRHFSVSQLLDTWEMSVRQASAPTQTPVTASTVLMSL